MSLPRTNRFKAEALLMLGLGLGPLLVGAIVILVFYVRNLLGL